MHKNIRGQKKKKSLSLTKHSTTTAHSKFSTFFRGDVKKTPLARLQISVYNLLLTGSIGKASHFQANNVK